MSHLAQAVENYVSQYFKSACLSTGLSRITQVLVFVLNLNASTPDDADKALYTLNQVCCV